MRDQDLAPMAKEAPMLKEYKPTGEELLRVNRDTLREYQVNIEFLSRGCIVRVGCKAIAFESVEIAMAELNRYVTNPYEVQREWRKILD